MATWNGVPCSIPAAQCIAVVRPEPMAEMFGVPEDAVRDALPSTRADDEWACGQAPYFRSIDEARHLIDAVKRD